MEVLSRSQLPTLLGSRDALDRSLGVTWQRVLHGAYVPVQVTIDLAVRASAAARLLPDHAHLSDRCLLWLHGVDVLPPGSPMLEGVVPRDKVVPKRSGMRLREADPPLGDRTEYAGLRVLRPARAVADMLRMLSLGEAVVVADAVLPAGLCTSDGLHRELTRHARLRGVRAAYRSWLARVDLAFPQWRVAIEYDGRGDPRTGGCAHPGPAALERAGARRLGGAALHRRGPAQPRRPGADGRGGPAARCHRRLRHPPAACTIRPPIMELLLGHRACSDRTDSLIGAVEGHPDGSAARGSRAR